MLLGARVMTFLYLHERQTFYEPLSSYDQLLRATLINARLVDSYVPPWARNRLTVSFRMFESTNESTNNAPEGIVSLPKIGEAERGTHAVAVDCGFTDAGERLRFVNSWGAGWGDKGTGVLSREYLERYIVDVWHSRNVLCRSLTFSLAAACRSYKR